MTDTQNRVTPCILNRTGVAVDSGKFAQQIDTLKKEVNVKRQPISKESYFESLDVLLLKDWLY